MSPQTIKHHHRVLHRALDQGIRWQLNVADAVRPPRVVPRKRPVHTEDESDALLEALRGSPFELPALLATFGGLRRGEVLALPWEEVALNADPPALTLRYALQETRKHGLVIKEVKTPSGRRVVALPSLVADALRKHRAAQAARRLELGELWADHGLVCPADDGRPWRPDSFSEAYGRFVRTLPSVPRIHFHDLRHTHASQLARLGISPRMVSGRLGHSDIAFTLKTYTHVLPAMDAEAALAIDRAIRTAMAGHTARSEPNP